MATDYEELYRQEKHALGEPTRQFVDFFRDYSRQQARVLDVGCGQGRDALFMARLGHRVTAVDVSASGITDLRRDARREGLAIDAEVADIRSYRPEGRFDVVVVDRTLHMLSADDRLRVLRVLIRATAEDGAVLIADEPSNIVALHREFDASGHLWKPLLVKRGFLFVGREHGRAPKFTLSAQAQRSDLS